MNINNTVNTNSYDYSKNDIAFLLKFTFVLLSIVLAITAFLGSYQNIKSNFTFKECPLSAITDKFDLYALTHTTDNEKIEKLLNNHLNDENFLYYVAKVGNSTLKKHLLNLEYLSSDVLVEICNNLTPTEIENIEFRKSLLSSFNTTNLNSASETNIINMDEIFFDFCLLKSTNLSTPGLIALLEGNSSINSEFLKSNYMQNLIISNLDKVNLNSNVISSISSYEFPTVNAYIEETYPTNTM